MIRADDRRATAGFTLLELLIAMAIFTVLGTMLIYFMRQSLEIFYTGVRESAMHDRMDIVLPLVQEDLEGLFAGGSLEAPPPELTEEERDARGIEKKQPPPPPVSVRMRAGFIRLRDVPAAVKSYPCPYFAFVAADASEWTDPDRRRAGERGGPSQVPMTPHMLDEGGQDTTFRATGGLREICWIAVPRDAMQPPSREESSYPAILTLYRGWRAPIGDPALSLLNPENVDSPDEILKACEAKAEGLLHFAAVWRRARATNWELSTRVGAGDPEAPYVGPVWDSTRGLDAEWPLFRGKQSLLDPSDDIFPFLVRLEVTLAGRPDGRGDFRLALPVEAEDNSIVVTDPDALMVANLGETRWVKVGTEWMEYRLRDVNYLKGEVRVLRAQRGTSAQRHGAGAWCYVGLPAELQMKLPMYRDRYVVKKEG